MNLSPAARHFLPSRFQIEPYRGNPSQEALLPSHLADKPWSATRLKRLERLKQAKRRRAEVLVQKVAAIGDVDMAKPVSSTPYMDDKGRLIFSRIVEGTVIDSDIVADAVRAEEARLARDLQIEEVRNHQHSELQSLCTRQILLATELSARQAWGHQPRRQHSSDDQMPAALVREIHRVSKHYWSDAGQRDAWTAGRASLPLILSFNAISSCCRPSPMATCAHERDRGSYDPHFEASPTSTMPSFRNVASQHRTSTFFGQQSGNPPTNLPIWSMTTKMRMSISQVLLPPSSGGFLGKKSQGRPVFCRKAQ